ncbi:MAG: DUF4166 domain-containing protein [Gammaproteobacteria bacterium]|nr:DUF4166 domain-containing protein [Gammaproteobacteria bacterium]
MRNHYNLHPNGEHELQLRGELSNVFHSLWVTHIILLGRLFGALVPYRGKDIPVEVNNYCKNNNLHWHRLFYFPNHAPYPFSSHMEYLGDNMVVEFVRFGLGLRLKLSVDEGALCYTTAGYLWRIGPLHLRLPDWLLLGSGTIIERGLDSEQIELDFTLKHPLFGLSFCYMGHFRIVSNEQEELMQQRAELKI